MSRTVVSSKSTPKFMVYGELGRYPLYISVKVRMLTFWANVINCNTSKLSGILYLLASRNHNINGIRIHGYLLLKVY